MTTASTRRRSPTAHGGAPLRSARGGRAGPRPIKRGRSLRSLITAPHRGRIVALAALLAAGACECGTPPPPPPSGAVGQITAAPVDGGFELRLENMTQSVRALQVDVKLEGAHATAAVAAQGSDLVEAALGDPKDDFTVVAGDTRRLNLPTGAVVRVTTDAAPSKISLSHAVAVDDSGARRDVTVVVP